MTDGRRDGEAGGLEAFVREWLGEVGGRLGLGLSFALRQGERGVVVEVTPPSGSTVPARRWGEVVGSLGLLCETAARHKGLPERPLSFRLVGVAAAGQAESAEAEGLVAAARAAAQVAVQLGRAFALGPMTVADRRLVHQALGDVSGVWTQSEGEGIYRRLWIVPRRSGGSGGRPAAAAVPVESTARGEAPGGGPGPSETP